MKALITGACGFAGKYLTDYLKHNTDWQILAGKLPFEKSYRQDISFFDLNISDFSETEKIIKSENTYREIYPSAMNLWVKSLSETLMILRLIL